MLWSFRGAEDSLSCVAKAEPMKRLCGMTVAPIMPIAKRGTLSVTYFEREKRCSHVYKPPAWKTFFEGTYPRNASPQSTSTLVMMTSMQIRTEKT